MSKRPVRRRARGNGSVERIAEGKYQIRYELPRVGTLGARRRRKEYVFGSKADAEQRLKDRLQEAHSGRYPDEDRLTFNTLADRFLEEKMISKEPTTVAWYRRQLTQHVRPKLGHLKLRDIRAHDVRTLLREARNTSNGSRQGEPLGPATLRNLHVAVRAVLEWGVGQGDIAFNVADKVAPPAQPDVERVVVRVEGIGALLAAAEGTELSTIVPVAIGTGLRRGELAALRWCDVDLERGTLRVRRAAANCDGKVILKAPKTKRSQRLDSMPAFVVAAMRRQKEEQFARLVLLHGGDELAARRAQSREDAVVFDRLDGRSWDPNEMSRQFSRLVRRKKLPPLRLHDLRHSYASLAFAAGVPLSVVSRSLGHSAIGVTDNIYLHLRDDALSEKADRLNIYLDEATRSARALTGP